jgi:phospholipase C
MGSIPHNRPSQVDANNKGKYDNWLEAKRSGDKKYSTMPLTLGYYNRDDLPFNYAMADAFTICDHNFSSGMTCTWPNRLFFFTGNVRSELSGEVGALMHNVIPWGSTHWKAFPEHLEENDISWRVYQNSLTTGGGLEGVQRSWLSNFGCNPLEFFDQYNAHFYPRYVESLKRRIELLPKTIAGLEEILQSTAYADDHPYIDQLKKSIAIKKQVLKDSQEELANLTPEAFEKLSPYQKNLYHKAFTTNVADPDYMTLSTLRYEDNGETRELPIPKSDVLYQFRKDVDEGKLPTVSWLIPSQNFSDHPSAPWYGAWFTSEILDILTKNPEVWKKTIFILTYDENDGYFDHLVPFVAPDKTNPETGKTSPGVNNTGVEYVYREQEIAGDYTKAEARTGPVGLGFRVPMIVASPWSRGGKVCSEIFDHTSTLQFLEKFLSKKSGKPVKQQNISAWRRSICGDLTSVFDNDKTRDKDKIDFLKMDPFIEKIYNAKFQKTPRNFRKLSPEEIAEIRENPSASTLLPRQEPGIRRSCALPYQLYVSGGLTADKSAVKLSMQSANEIFGSRTAGSPFKVYAPDNYVTAASKDSTQKKYEAARSWDYTVTAGDTLSEEWPLEHFEGPGYHLRVYGPNGFFREFRGDKSDPGLDIRCDYERSRMLKTRATGNLELTFSNADTAKTYHVEITDNAYGNRTVTKTVAAGEVSAVLNLKKSHGWYDITVTVKEIPSFSRRFAGRVETGKDSYSDPVIGRKA